MSEENATEVERNGSLGESSCENGHSREGESAEISTATSGVPDDAKMVVDRKTRSTLVGRGLRLEYVTVGWNIVEGTVSVIAALAAGSVALLGFGMDSFVETLSGAILIWRLRAERGLGDLGTSNGSTGAPTNSWRFRFSCLPPTSPLNRQRRFSEWSAPIRRWSVWS